jgi:ABC-type transport system involved in multi-copper enzyme maturation permease subunit
MFTFDGVSGEKESRTLALCLANPVPRGTLLLGNYLGAMLSVMALVLVGVLVGFLVIHLPGRVEAGGALFESPPSWP